MLDNEIKEEKINNNPKKLRYQSSFASNKVSTIEQEIEERIMQKYSQIRADLKDYPSKWDY